ncbi:unnamed protein product [Danaus chrysippus]|uniref:(African queen) hypothetical protein n=1 Tax=Danaus chrysippus TaxID=151541 RepID=A0A8J2VRW0_9NEOP|nr:unnamed protein product [Danaus chrysippus]
MDPIMDVIKNSEEPEWLEKRIIGELRLWQIIFLCLAGVTSLIVIVCCCFRFRIPRTKQQIEADYKRRKITSKFRQQLETIQDSKMDTISLKDALELLHEKTHTMEGENQTGSQQSSIMSPQQSSLEASFQAENGQKNDPQPSGLNFVKFATKVANLSKLGTKSPTSPTSTDNKMDF